MDIEAASKLRSKKKKKVSKKKEKTKFFLHYKLYILFI